MWPISSRKSGRGGNVFISEITEALPHFLNAQHLNEAYSKPDLHSMDQLMAPLPRRARIKRQAEKHPGEEPRSYVADVLKGSKAEGRQIIRQGFTNASCVPALKK